MCISPQSVCENSLDIVVFVCENWIGIFEAAGRFSPLVTMGTFFADLQTIEFKYQEQNTRHQIIALTYKLDHLTWYLSFLINSVTVYNFSYFLQVTGNFDIFMYILIDVGRNKIQPKVTAIFLHVHHLIPLRSRYRVDYWFLMLCFEFDTVMTDNQVYNCPVVWGSRLLWHNISRN